MGKIIWTDSALNDLKDIKNNIALDSVDYADYFIDKIFEAAEILETFPRIGKIVQHPYKKDYRRILFKKYRIVYRIIKEKVHIARVLEGHRLLDF